MDIGDFFAMLAVLVTLVALYFAYQVYQQTRYSRLFSSFDIASQITASNPAVMRRLHGLDSSVDDDEAISIATLSAILDGYQHSYGISSNPFETRARGYQTMLNSMTTSSEYLNNLLALKENQDRWDRIKTIYYGDFDRDFVEVVDKLIEFENSKKPEKLDEHA